MRIILTKISDERYGLEIVHANGLHEHVDLESKTYLMHDFIHFALESEAKLSDGFWGALAAGKTLGDMSDRTGERMKEYSGSMAQIEMTVGALSGVTKGRTAGEIIIGLENIFGAGGSNAPSWLTVPLIAAVQERLRKLLGHWNATPYSGTMELDWMS